MKEKDMFIVLNYWILDNSLCWPIRHPFRFLSRKKWVLLSIWFILEDRQSRKSPGSTSGREGGILVFFLGTLVYAVTLLPNILSYHPPHRLPWSCQSSSCTPYPIPFTVFWMLHCPNLLSSKCNLAFLHSFLFLKLFLKHFEVSNLSHH